MGCDWRIEVQAAQPQWVARVTCPLPEPDFPCFTTMGCDLCLISWPAQDVMDATRALPDPSFPCLPWAVIRV